MKKTKLVTAFYTEVHGHPFYGHQDLARHERYLHSMRVLDGMNIEISCYCNENQFELLTNHINTFNLKNITLKISNLIDFPFLEKMIQIKELTNSFKFYHEIDWNKIFLLNKEYDESYEYIYWIDVGLSHHGIFPNKYNPNYILATGMSNDFNTYSFTKLFTPKLFEGINNFVNNGLISIENKTHFHSTHQLGVIFEKIYNYPGLTVGGILGGHISKLKWFIDKFNTLGIESLNKEIILNHEAIISFIKESSPEYFKNFIFETWYHEDTLDMSENIIKNQTHFSDFFDFIYNQYIQN